MTYDSQKDTESLFQMHFLPTGAGELSLSGVEIDVPADFAFNELDQVPDYCYLVKNGRIICYDLTLNGNQRVFNIFEKGSLFLEECVLFDKPAHVMFRSLTSAKLLRISKCDLKRTLKDYDEMLNFCKYQSVKFLSNMEMIRVSTQKNTEWQVCKLLQIFMEHYGKPYDGKIMITERISQQMVADILGVNRVTVTRIFRNLRGAFLEQINGNYCIRSAELLQEYIKSLE
ncbi:MAG: Crp/Fnr family transcriptional regulator [Bacillota bacterium]|nr:Crp/Fnr family transcriptional regulator [Bacillota bacterium]